MRTIKLYFRDCMLNCKILSPFLPSSFYSCDSSRLYLRSPVISDRFERDISIFSRRSHNSFQKEIVYRFYTQGRLKFNDHCTSAVIRHEVHSDVSIRDCIAAKSRGLLTTTPIIVISIVIASTTRCIITRENAAVIS